MVSGPLTDPAIAAIAVGALVAGLLAGFAYYGVLWGSVRKIAASSGSLWQGLAPMARLALVVALFGVAAWLGLPVLLPFAIGFAGALPVALRRFGASR